MKCEQTVKKSKLSSVTAQLLEESKGMTCPHRGDVAEQHPRLTGMGTFQLLLHPSWKLFPSCSL